MKRIPPKVQIKDFNACWRKLLICHIYYDLAAVWKTVFSLTHKSFRIGLLALTLMLAGAANLFTVSVDNDGDEETPPITIQLNFVASQRKTVHLHKAEISRHAASVNAGLIPQRPVLSENWQGSFSISQASGSPQFVVPLRT
ncbi:MAG TPA: hypothetical protein VFT65_07055 [Candidatus Angelobacter sp.]|nr:hypothetical protein [Candidatus Angelobacter sp.]